MYSMRSSKLILFSFLLGTIFFGSTSFRSTNNIEGLWVQESYQDGKHYMVRAKRFSKNKPGVKFLANGKLIKRQNVGWCGTPPITYGNFDGTWQWISDSLIHVSYEYWGGTAEYDWKVLKLTDKKLVTSWD
jgi:hypothetical protein